MIDPTEEIPFEDNLIEVNFEPDTSDTAQTIEELLATQEEK